jgi:dTDP-4-amino-4,6-dideoxygalactose transaminase
MSAHPAIPFVDLSPVHREAGVEIEDAVLRVIRSRRFVLGPEVEAFEEEFARAVDVRHCVGVDSGTSALRLALQSLGIGPGDEVITTPFTFIATVEAIRQTGARAVLADVDPLTWNLDPQAAEDAITHRTRAILPVHLHGRPVDLGVFEDICHRNGLFLVEDAAQAHLASSRGRKCGSVGEAGCFSFYPGKNLGAVGEGGAVTTNDPQVAKRVRMLRDFGSERKYEHILQGGTNARLESIQAAALRAKLPHLEDWTVRRVALADLYRKSLAGLPIDLPAPVGQGDRHVWHVFAVAHRERDRLRQRMLEAGVETSSHYPVPLHLQPACAHLGGIRGDFPVAESIASRNLSLPFWVGMPDSAVSRVVESLAEALRSS